MLTTLCGITEEHGLGLFQRRYVGCSCKGWDEFWDQVDEAKKPIGITLKGRSNHQRRCTARNL